MANKPRFMKPVTGGRPQPTEVNVDVSKLEELVCSECGGERFVQLLNLKRLPAILSPNFKEGVVFQPAGIACSDCGAENSARPRNPASFINVPEGNDGPEPEQPE